MFIKVFAFINAFLVAASFNVFASEKAEMKESESHVKEEVKEKVEEVKEEAKEKVDNKKEEAKEKVESEKK